MHEGEIEGLDQILKRSDALESAIVDLLGANPYRLDADSTRMASRFAACSVSMEPAQGLRTLIREGLPRSGVSLMRLQHEALTRAVWLLYAVDKARVQGRTTGG